MKNRRLLIIILGIILLTGCPEDILELNMEIRIVNNSSEDIVWLGLTDYILSDTSKLVEKYPWRYIEDHIISSGSMIIDEFNSDNMKYLLNEGWLIYYLFSYDTILTVPWDRIRDENIVLKKVYFETWEDLEAYNFTITYP